MKSMVSKVAAVVMLAATTGVGARAQFSTACTDATLKGDYSVTISGQIFLPGGVVVQRLGINITHFDGAGHLSQEDLVLSSPNAPAPLGVPPKNASGFQIDETGTYTVNPDCTGMLTINFPNLTTSTGGSVKGAVISAHFTISDSGRAVHILVTSLTPPGAPGPVPALISSEGRKIGPIEQD
jgi:hypothetical protein